MKRIDSIHIHNFKFFDKQEPIKLGGKHLLLYGENGSGKSSIYWALYTLLEASGKDADEVDKYFKSPSSSEESLVNRYANPILHTDGSTDFQSYISLKTTEIPPAVYKLSITDKAICGNSIVQEINRVSDFINYHLLFKFQDHWNGARADLKTIFENNILSYISFSDFQIWRNGNLKTITNAAEMWREFQVGPGMTKIGDRDPIQVYKNSRENIQFEKFTKHFNNEFKDLIDHINANAPALLKRIGYDIEFNLKYFEPVYKKKDKHFDCAPFRIEFVVTSFLGVPMDIYRPQSFLNEAKITAIALSIRLTILNRIGSAVKDKLKFLVLDDLMISLDMNNRDKLIDYLLDKNNGYLSDYQLLFLTHDRNFFDFMGSKIKQWDNISNWEFKELYTGEDKPNNKEFPIIIDSHLEFIDKAKKYYSTKDYTASAIYIRKELEKIVNLRLPDELKSKTDGSYLSLQTLWSKMVIRYDLLGNQITDDLKKIFEETKLLVLNPQAHFQAISLPIYKVELDKAFKLIEQLNLNYPIPVYTILLSKGMKLQFKHPSQNYTFDFELLSDFYIDGMNGASVLHFPKCKVNSWQYDGTDFFCPGQKKVINSKEVHKRLDDKLDDVLTNLKKDTVLNITNQIFIDNTSIESSIWSLKEILDKAKITF